MTYVPATSMIPAFIDMVAALLDKGYAYIAGGNVYFDTSKPENYAVFHNHRADDLAEGVRESVTADPNKRNKTDFVLWFTKSKFEDQQLKWDSPWGVGYPGWHIECSAISLKHNGEYLDIHCGGIDNQFPHHTNEIAQSEAFTGHPWCGCWFHVLHLNTENGKMSKSAGEFLTVSLLESRGFDPLAYRFFCLQSHYRKSQLFSFEALRNAAGAYGRLLARIAALKEAPDASEAEDLAPWRERFRAAMDADLNTSLGITCVYDVLKSGLPDGAKLRLIDEFDRVLSLDLLCKARALRGGEPAVVPNEEDRQIEALVRQRDEARKARDWAAADRLRDELTAMGVALYDTPQGSKWRRTSGNADMPL